MKILIVEDSNMKFEDIEYSLDFLNNPEIVRVKTRNEAIQCLYDEGNIFDVAIFDMQFPSMIGGEMLRDGGLQVLKRIRHRKIDVPVIFCSSGYTEIPADLENVAGYIVYGGNGSLSELLKHYIKSALEMVELKS
jgi:CheY-like chemotaxis protein